MLKNETKEIRGKNYKVTQLPTDEGQRMLVKLFKLGGPAFVQLASSADPNAEVNMELLKSGAVSGVIEKLAAEITPKQFDEIVETFRQQTEVENETGDGWVPLDKKFHFAGRYKAMFEWLGFCLQLNYGDFLDD